MQIVVHCNAALKEELLSNGLQRDLAVVWAFEKVDLLKHTQADAVIDLLFEKDSLQLLQQFKGLKIINSVIDTLAETDAAFIRINGWPTFLKAPIIEASCVHEDLKKLVETLFSLFNKKLEWLPDAPGFVVPRVVSMIINEAYFALAANVSSRGEIDVAMKLGTAYPFGPFEWSDRLGLKNVAALLIKLSTHQKRYAPAPLLLQQAGVS